jgi:DNA-binding transcriptional regulator YdaS (Cro superfamily)
VGVQRITSELSRAGEPVTPGAVYQWISGQRAPRAGRAVALVRLSAGAIGLGDIYAHAVAVRSLRENSD